MTVTSSTPESNLQNIFFNDAEVSARKIFKELKVLFDADGWSAFDKEQAALFDDLNAAFGATPVDTKDDAEAAQHNSTQEGQKRSYLEKRGHSDRTESASYQLLTVGRLGTNKTVLGDGISKLKYRSDHVEFSGVDGLQHRSVWCDSSTCGALPR